MPSTAYSLGAALVSLYLIYIAGYAGTARGQIQGSGQCPDYFTSLLFTPLVMLNVINNGPMYLALSLGNTEDRTGKCQTLTFDGNKTFFYYYLDSNGRNITVNNTYKMSFPSITNYLGVPYTKNTYLKLSGLPKNVLGADFTGRAKLIPVAYGFGIAIFVTCTNYVFFNTQRFYLFLSTSIDLGPYDYHALANTLVTAGFIPASLQLDVPDQSCRRKNTKRTLKLV